MKEELKDLYASCIKKGSFYDFEKSEYNYDLDSEQFFEKLEEFIENKEKEAFKAGRKLNVSYKFNVGTMFYPKFDNYKISKEYGK